MRLKSPAQAPEFDVHDAARGQRVRLSDFRGQRVALSFFRNTSCPFCNLRVYELTHEYAKLKRHGLELIAFFRSSEDEVRRFVQQRPRPFIVAADPDMRIYQPYGIEHSWGGFLRGMALRMPRLFQAMGKGFMPSMRGDQSLVPADFLIDERGRIVRSYYGRDIGDHLPMSTIHAFAMGPELADTGTHATPARTASATPNTSSEPWL